MVKEKERNKIVCDFLKKNDISPDGSRGTSNQSSIAYIKGTKERNSKVSMSDNNSPGMFNIIKEIKNNKIKEFTNLNSNVLQLASNTRFSSSVDRASENNFNKMSNALQIINKKFNDIIHPNTNINTTEVLKRRMK